MGGGVQRVERIVVAEDARPVGRGDGGRSAVNRGDAGLEVIFAQVGALCGRGEFQETARDERLVPLRAVLLFEAEEVAVFVDARRETRGAEIHEGEERVGARCVAGGVRDEECGEADGFGAAILAEEAFAGGGLIAFVEEEIERGEHAIEARCEVFALGQGEGEAGVLDALLGARELLLDGGFAAEKRARDLAGAETAEDF